MERDDIEWFLRYGQGETPDIASYLGYSTRRNEMKKTYTVLAHRLYGAFGSGDGHYGPFESRTEAERTMASVAAGGKFQEVTIQVKQVEEEDEES